jgi:hypothetical protein
MPEVTTKAKPSDVVKYFSHDDEHAHGREMKTTELLQLRREDAEGYDHIAEGIGNGTLTY